MNIRAIFFDAVGTLLHPDPPAGEVYARIGQTFGSGLDPAEIVRRFAVSFARQEALDEADGLHTSAEREVARWRAIVGEVLDDVVRREDCFQALWDHFARPASWRLEAETDAVLRTLAGAGLRLGLASNFDARLHSVQAGFPALNVLHHVVVSAEIGWRKPSPHFFAELTRRTNLLAEEILLVGDDPYNDVAGAQAAGLRGLLFDPRGQPTEAGTLRCLADLPRYPGVFR